MKLIKITNNFAIFRDGNQIISKPLNQQAQAILDWNNKNIPANYR